MKNTFYVAFSLSLALSSQLHAQDFCTNLPQFIDDVGFKESFTQLRGAQTNHEEWYIGDEKVLTTTYAPKTDLIPGVPGRIVHNDYEGDLDSWTYIIDYSISNALQDQQGIAAYWQETIKKCVEKEEGWTFKLEKRKFSADSQMESWRACKTMDGYLGLRVINVEVVLFEEFDESFRPTGRYGVRLNVF